MNAHFRHPDDSTWKKQAACHSKDIDPEIFFPGKENGPSLSKARSICSRCPVKQSCLQDAMATEGGKPAKSRFGVYAGLTGWQRYGLYTRARERARLARPADTAKQPKPEPKKREPAKCGTRSGYQRHLREKTEICGPCRQANTDADNRLRRTGTTKKVAA